MVELQTLMADSAAIITYDNVLVVFELKSEVVCLFEAEVAKHFGEQIFGACSLLFQKRSMALTNGSHEWLSPLLFKLLTHTQHTHAPFRYQDNVRTRSMWQSSSRHINIRRLYALVQNCTLFVPIVHTEYQMPFLFRKVTFHLHLHQ